MNERVLRRNTYAAELGHVADAVSEDAVIRARDVACERGRRLRPYPRELLGGGLAAQHAELPPRQRLRELLDLPAAEEEACNRGSPPADIGAISGNS